MSPTATRFFAFGHRCSASAILDRCGLASASLPFDGLISKLGVIRDCLETDFAAFLNIDNYVRVETATVNIIDGVVEEILTESPCVNRYYEEAAGFASAKALTGASTYHLQLAFTHHDLSSPGDYQSFTRKIRRLRGLLLEKVRKVCLYIHPVLGLRDYERQKAELLDEFNRFSEFLADRYANISCLFFIPVKVRDADLPVTQTLILENDVCSVHVIHANKDFVDANAPFSGDCEREIAIMTDLVKRAEPSRGVKYKMYFSLFDDPESASNEMRLTHEGLLAHPQVTLVDDPEAADYLIFCQNHLVDHQPFHPRFRALKDRYKQKSILLDYADDPETLLDADDFRWRLYLKRSCVDRENGRLMSYGDLPVHPTAYGVVNDMGTPPAGHDGKRGLDVSCLFDDGVLSTPYFTMARGRLLKFARRLAATHGALSMQLGTVTECGPVGRSRIDPRYKRCLFDSKVILHANPDPWEGDARLWEALASGALVFVDRMYTPLAHPLIDGEHLIFYDLTDEGMELLERRIIHYLNDDEERRRIAGQGRDFVINHHRSVDRVDEIIRLLERPDVRATGWREASPELDIIVSIATGYTDVDQYRPFISTLRRTGATCPVFLGISDGPQYDPVKRYLLDNSVNYFVVPDIDPPGKVVNGYRFAQYAQWLRLPDFRYALMMDFRDAYFQRDPFLDVQRFMQDCDLYLMSEFQLLTIGNHPNGMNRDWVAEPFGEEAADAIADEVILNSGAILGRKSAVMKLLAAFTEVTTSQNFDFADQGTLNYLGHTGRLLQCGRIKIERAGESLVNNCGFTELDLLRQVRPVTAEEEARIAFIPRGDDGRLRLYRDHEGWVLDDDGNVSYAVHQYDRFEEMEPFVARLSEHECAERVFVNSGSRRYRGEKYTLSSREGLQADAVARLITTLRTLPVDRKPLLALDPHFRRGLVFTYGVLNIDLLFTSPSFRQCFFDPTQDGEARARFLEERGYRLHLVEESELFVAAEPARTLSQTARGFSEARERAERWTAP
ncbi:MAG TPA: DUF1796 family putative cysteine peptidase [Polyangia bacterium]|jgi:hypothetical protein